MSLDVILWLLQAMTIAIANKITKSSLKENYPESSQHSSCSTANFTLACTSPWQYCIRGECTCGSIPANRDMECYADKNLTLVNDYCVTMNSSGSGYSTYIGNCLYQSFSQGKQNVLPNNPDELNELVCGKYFNRREILCGKCKKDHYPLVFSFDMNCIKCSNKFFNVFKLILAAYLPLTIFFFIVVLFKINATSPHIRGYVLCCQGLAMPTIARKIIILTTTRHKEQDFWVRATGTIFSIWNLDILRFLKLNICLETDSLQNLALDLVVGIYPLLLIVLVYLLIRLHDNNFKPLVIAWKPFKAFLNLFNKTWDIKTSLVDGFATFFLLANIKFLVVAYDILTPVHVDQLLPSGNHTFSLRLYYDATVPYFGKRHLPYAVLALAVLILFLVVPVLLLILYPFRWFQKLLNLFPFNWYVLHTFMDIYQGCYKDGTEPGTRDCRWFAVIFLLLRFLLVAIDGVTLTLIFFPLISMVLVIVVILLITVQPFKPHLAHYSSVNATFLLLLALFYISFSGYETAYVIHQHFKGSLFVTLGGVFILVYTSAITLQWMWNQKTFGVAAVVKRLCLWRLGYQKLQ